MEVFGWSWRILHASKRGKRNLRVLRGSEEVLKGLEVSGDVWRCLEESEATKGKLKKNSIATQREIQNFFSDKIHLGLWGK